MTAQRFVEATFVTLLAIGILRIVWLYWQDEQKRKRSEQYKRAFREGKVHLTPVRQSNGALVRDLRHRRLRLRYAYPLPHRTGPRRPSGRDPRVLRRGAAVDVPENRAREKEKPPD